MTEQQTRPPRNPDARSRLFEMILSMDPQDAPAPAVLERLLDQALAEEAADAVHAVILAIEAEARSTPAEALDVCPDPSLHRCPHGHLWDAANTRVRRTSGRTCRTCDRNRKRTARLSPESDR